MTAGKKFINKNITWWPGGKPQADSFLNILGDNLSAAAGYWCGFYLDKVGTTRGWYN